MGRIFDGCRKFRGWPALWPRREPPTRRGYKPEDPNMDLVPFPEIKAEDVQRRIDEVLFEIEGVSPVNHLYKHFSATEIHHIRKLVAAFELSLEQAVRNHIQLMRDLSPLGRHLEKIGPSWRWEALVARVDTVAAEHGLEWDAALDLVVEWSRQEGEGLKTDQVRGGWVRFKGGWEKGDRLMFDTQEDLDRYKNIFLGETEEIDDNGEDED